MGSATEGLAPNGTTERSLYRIVLKGDGIYHHLLVDKIAWTDQGALVAISCHAPLPVLKALKAALHSNNLPIEFISNETNNIRWRIQKSQHLPYKVHVHKHAYHDGHLVAHMDFRGLILNLNDEVLWRILKDDHYTTPILREWVPWLKERMLEQERLTEYSGVGCSIHELSLTVEDLDKLVSEGLSTRQLRIRGGA